MIEENVGIRNHSDLAAYDTGAGASGTKTNKQTSTQLAAEQYTDVKRPADQVLRQHTCCLETLDTLVEISITTPQTETLSSSVLGRLSIHSPGHR